MLPTVDAYEITAERHCEIYEIKNRKWPKTIRAKTETLLTSQWNTSFSFLSVWCLDAEKKSFRPLKN